MRHESSNRSSPEEQLAHEAHLRYVRDSQPGYSRRRRGHSFSYFAPNGTAIRDSRVLNRIRDLTIPPAWTDVWICQSPRGHLQCTGRDQRARKQYLYHPDWARVSNLSKFAGMLEFGTLLPRIRRHVRRDLNRTDWNQDRLNALAVRMLDRIYIRVGNQEYLRDNSSYGLTTLMPEHLTIAGNVIQLSFDGKSGKHQELVFRDRTCVRLLRELALSGPTLLSYCDQGTVIALTSGDINDYLHRISSETITAKDFRTWHASSIAMASLRIGLAQGIPARRNIPQAIRAAATALGNTSTVCRKYYIHPEILHLAEENRLGRALKTLSPLSIRDLTQAEQELFAFLQHPPQL